MIFKVVIFFDAIGKIRTSKVFFCRSSDQLKSHFRRCDVVVVINLKAIFDVLKKIGSRSSEIRCSDPLPILFTSFKISFMYIFISFLETKCQHWIRAVIFVAARCTPPGTWSTTRRPTQFQSTSATRKAFAIRSVFDAVRMFYDVL